MSTYRELQNQIEDLQRKAVAARKEEVGTTIRDIKRKIAEFGLTAADIGLAPAPAKVVGPGKRAAKAAEKAAAELDGKGARKKQRRATSGKKVAPKYRGVNGELWTGRGRQPGWVVSELSSGRALVDLLIK